MTVKRVRRDVRGKVVQSRAEKRLRMSLTQDNSLTITFPRSIAELVRPITKDDGDIPVEYLFTFLEQYVSLRARAVLAASGVSLSQERPDIKEAFRLLSFW